MKWALLSMACLACSKPAATEAPAPSAVPTATEPSPPAIPGSVASATPTSEPPVAEPSSEPKAETQTLFVHAELADCVGESPRKCLKIKRTAEAEWEFFYAKIKGFEHEAGNFYELKVNVTPVPNAPADSGAVNYELVEVVKKSTSPL